MVSIKTPLYFFEAVILDLLAIPGLFMSKKANAKWHLKIICPLCSKWRKSFRCGTKNHNCIWYESWKRGNFYFPRSFGIKNWIRYYFGMKTKLRAYNKEYLEWKRENKKRLRKLEK
jgi:hypothetical protein